MATRTPEQNRAIYQRRSERAREQGTTYGKIKYEQDKARIRKRAIKAYEKLGRTERQAISIVDGPGVTLAIRRKMAKGPEVIRNEARKQGPDEDDEDDEEEYHNPFWYHTRS
jgi:hypothetical protein